VTLGTGVKAVTPTYGINRLDVNNPYVSYDFTGKIGDVQMRNSPGISYVTIPEYRNSGESSALSWDQSLAYEISHSRVFATFDTSLGYYIYDRGYINAPVKKGGDGNAQRYSVTIYPGFKYRYSDQLSLATSLNISEWNPRAQDSSLVMWRSSVTQRFAVGWAIQHDIYLQPYIDVYPQALAFDTTTINISTIFSIL
jgi:hypothetical protein